MKIRPSCNFWPIFTFSHQSISVFIFRIPSEKVTHIFSYYVSKIFANIAYYHFIYHNLMATIFQSF